MLLADENRSWSSRRHATLSVRYSTVGLCLFSMSSRVDAISLPCACRCISSSCSRFSFINLSRTAGSPDATALIVA